jgi:hypothetical protein
VTCWSLPKKFANWRPNELSVDLSTLKTILAKEEEKTMASFTVHGPYVIPTMTFPNGKFVTGPQDFWGKAAARMNEVGCYIFAIKAGQGFTPWYVGKTKTTFKGECFTADKINKYNKAIMTYKKGSPVLFFVSHPKQRGPTNHKEIREIEVFFTQIALAKNEKILNIKNAKQQSWSIQGILRGSQGKVAESTKDLKKTLGL